MLHSGLWCMQLLQDKARIPLVNNSPSYKKQPGSGKRVTIIRKCVVLKIAIERKIRNVRRYTIPLRNEAPVPIASKNSVNLEGALGLPAIALRLGFLYSISIPTSL